MIILCAPTHQRAENWFRIHMTICDRRPTIITRLDQLHGLTGAILFLLPEFVTDSVYEYKLERNTVIDLRGYNV